MNTHYIKRPEFLSLLSTLLVDHYKAGTFIKDTYCGPDSACFREILLCTCLIRSICQLDEFSEIYINQTELLYSFSSFLVDHYKADTFIEKLIAARMVPALERFYFFPALESMLHMKENSRVIPRIKT